MSRKVSLPTSLNMSLGFIPVIISIVLCEFISQDWAIYTGAFSGVVYSCLYHFKGKNKVPNCILYITTAVLIFFSIFSLASPYNFPESWCPLTLETGTVIPLFLIYLFQNQILNFFQKRKATYCIQGAEAGIVSIRIVLICSFFHFAAISLYILFIRSPESTLTWILFYIAPLVVFIFTILFNQSGLAFFNHLMSQTEYIPVMNEKGGVTGKIIETDLAEKGNTIMIPVIRIAIENNGMLFLNKRPDNDLLDAGKTDTPLETILYYSEGIEDGVNRLMNEYFTGQKVPKPRFNIKYHFINSETNRQVYLFLLQIKDDRILSKPMFSGGKLWTLKQIEQNIDMEYFSECFEYEWEHLEAIIYTIKKYTES